MYFHTLSKSQYVKAVQCPKMLWMDCYNPDKAEDMGTQAVFDTGSEIGDLAREYFGKYTLIDFSYNKEQMVRATKQAINAGAQNIAEASFFTDGLFCSVDILHKTPDGWDLVEVKSSTELHDIYLDDMAFQYFVLQKAGISVTAVYNMHLNKQYTRLGDLDLQSLFTLQNCTSQILAMQKNVREHVKEIQTFMQDNETHEPTTPIGIHCEKPYTCAYRAYCRRNLSKPNVFDLNFGQRKQYELYNMGLIRYEDIAEKAHLTSRQKMLLDAELFSLPPYINRDKITACIRRFTYPLYFLDFETCQYAVPRFNGTRPYMQVPFQYSLHIQQSQNAPLEHREFLAKEGTDPRRALAEQLCRDIPQNVCTLAYNMKFEKSVIRNLAYSFPDLAEHLMNIHDHILDLMEPFQSRYYYDTAFHGSFSIKAVLPVMCPGDPELDYHHLNGVHNGTEAMNAFKDLEKRPPQEIAQIRKNLLAYCRLDTLAMVKILEKLRQICTESK